MFVADSTVILNISNLVVNSGVFWASAALMRYVCHAVDRATPFATPAGLHFLACLRRYGSPVICLNLVKKKERKKRESLLTEELQSSIVYLNQFLPPEHHIQYIHKDMARINKRFASLSLCACRNIMYILLLPVELYYISMLLILFLSLVSSVRRSIWLIFLRRLQMTAFTRQGFFIADLNWSVIG